MLHRHAREHPDTLEFFKIVTSFGDLRTVLSGSIFMLVALLVLRRWGLAGIWGVTTLAGFQLVDVIKSYYGRPRPHFFDPIALEITPSFPSGHAADSAMLYGMLVYVLLRSTRKLGLAVILPMLLLVGLIGFSRLYLGAHWLSDVVAGWMLGFGWVALGMAGAEAGRAS
jgi:undecaprenyl-diphosphatase